MESWQIGVIIVLVILIGYLWLNTEHLTDGTKPYIVLFSQDWCPACQEFKPTWDKFAGMTVVTDVVNPIQLDPLPFNVGSYPTIRYYKRNPQEFPDEFVVFKGQRNLGQLLKFIKDNKALSD